MSRRAAAPDGAASPTVDIGQWHVDLADRVTGRDDGGGEVTLTPTEWKLLEAFVRHPGKLIGQRQMLAEVWGPNSPLRPARTSPAPRPWC